MKFEISLGRNTLQQAMRKAGYAPASAKASAGKPDEYAFYRPLRGMRYPRFHIYSTVADDKETATLNLHLDQKQPSYRGTSAHSGEYSGDLVEKEIQRIQNSLS